MIRDVFEQKAPANSRAVFRIAPGQRQVLLAFTMPNSSDTKAMYAVPVGNFDEGVYNFFTDEIFFYDDPHVLYKHWGPEMWAHVDKHEPALGMSENQAMMALGQVITPHGDNAGDRNVSFQHAGEPVAHERTRPPDGDRAGDVSRAVLVLRATVDQKNAALDCPIGPFADPIVGNR